MHLLPFEERQENMAEITGRHVGTRTPDLYRVKSEVKPLQPYSCLAFPFSHLPKIALKQPIFGDELVTSFVQVNLSALAFPARRFLAHGADTRLRGLRPHKAF